jgi:4-hydroxybenzoate polyprenyltransferase
MTEHTDGVASPRGANDSVTAEDFKVIAASSVGSVFELLDFFLYGSLAVILSKHFFSGVDETTAFTLALLKLPLLYTLTLAGYAVLTTVYSFWLKRKMVIDVITLAVLYTLRIVAGAVALDIPLSFWLLAFSMFMFLSLALVKRYAELVGLAVNGTGSQQKVRGYFIDDLPMLASLGSGAGYMAVMVLALYINDSRTAQLYRHPQFIWLACPLLLVWIVRAWMLAHRDAMNEDPVIFAVRDHISLIIGALMLLVFWIAA